MKSRRRYLLLLAPILLIGLLLFALPLPIGSSFRVNGPLSAQDIKAIRHELRHMQQRGFRSSILHCRFGSFWDQISVTGTCPLVAVESDDGKSAAAKFDGRSWSGNQVSMQYRLTNSAGVWSCAGMARRERVTRAN